jgi:lipid-binding SYLF domain-containing protein
MARTLPAVALFTALFCATSGDVTAQQQAPSEKVLETIDRFKETDAGMADWFEKAAGYAVFASVGKGGIGIGGAHGNGEVVTGGQAIGKTTVTQVTVGLQLGGQSFSQIIFFKEQSDLDSFTAGNFEFNAQVSAVALTTGASADAGYDHGVAVFTLAKGGLMYEASVGGQKFSFEAY